MSGIFPNQDLGAHIIKHRSLPIYEAIAFDFYRRIPFIESFYGKTISRRSESWVQIVL